MSDADRCPGTNRNGEQCGHPAGWGTDHSDGPCKFHGGVVGDDHGAPEGNQNARSHGLHSDPANLLDDLAENDPDAYDWVMKKHDGYLADAPFEAGSAKADQLLQICVREYTIWKASGIQVDEGVIKRTHTKDSSGELVEVEDEHAVNLSLDRMERTVTRRLKVLGVLDDPESQKADALARSNENYEFIEE